MFAHILAVVGGIDYDGIVRDFTIAQGSENFSDFLVQPLCKTVVKLTAFTYNLVRDVLDVKADTQMFIVSWLGFEVALRNFGYGDLAFVKLPLLLRHNQGKMRGKVAD